MQDASSSGEQTAVFQIDLTNQLSEVTRLNQWLTQTVAPTCGLSEKVIFRLELILEETLTNVIDYAFETAGLQVIRVNLQNETQTITVQIIDGGKPFNPLEDYQVNLPDTLDQAGMGGLGLHLVRGYAQSCQYARKNDQNIFTVVVAKNS